MAFNRLVDRKIDAANPRTADRALPTGEVSPAFVSAFVLVSIGVFLLAAWQLNATTLKLSLVALPVLLGYSYTKRFTWLSHLVLGLALAGAPLGAWVAVRGSFAPTPTLLAGAVTLWVAGFDVLYALQDLDFDRRSGLHSIAVKLGDRGALWVSGLFHLGMIALLVVLPRFYEPRLGRFYWLGVAGCAVLIAYQHWVVRPGDLSRLNAAFFFSNSLLAAWLFVTTAADLLLR
jgi:4-hydroxybenzoate polyprenyltransferase